ncbi:class II fructose-bisphosphate aldolase [Dyadobacter sp. CY323]|uniref:class II fructose-bisphosphate aldolase n=1 Tax=Dyadobacter sp. CY323 TaxID=2907302 RepID=UPI001F375B5D|nr:class II fructose-bisphosphate aldolase [Dyadobacter sp. CY323]MCE6988097.1 class II fructose-bisphosphate aldolase [Dyadobacter sp. CY323]
MKLKEKLRELTQLKKGLLATNYYDLETLHGVLQAAADLKQPVILQLTQSSIDYMGLKTAVNLGRNGLEEFGVEGWIHLDHGGSVELVQRCLDAGFDSVMIDGSELPFEQNVSLTREVVELAKRYDAHVEAELGYVAKLGQSHNGTGFTQPDEAAAFVDATGVDALAVAIGTAHGFYKQEPRLDIDLLRSIAEKTPATLVLHGSSGVPHTQVKRAISNGICKVNLATEIKNIFMASLKAELTDNQDIDLRKVFPKATVKITELVKTKLEMVENAAE